MSRAKRGGRGVYVCTACGHRTPYGGADTIGLCDECWEIARIFNVHQEGGDLAPHAVEIRERCARIIARGGTLNDDAKTLLARVGSQAGEDAAMAEKLRAMIEHIHAHADELAILIPSACFALESVAHLRGMERQLLPMTIRMRAILAGKAVKS
jgi:hypothetical protein